MAAARYPVVCRKPGRLRGPGGRPPHSTKLPPPIAEEYYACAKCGSLHGGIYGKGPLTNFAGANAAKCWHDWHQIAKAEFQELAADRFPAEWEKAGYFIKRPAIEASSPAPVTPGS